MSITIISDEAIQDLLGYTMVSRFGRQLVAIGDYGRYSINHIWFKKTLCYSVRCDDFSVRNPKKKMFVDAGSWYREQKNEMIISLHDSSRANSILATALEDVFLDHKKKHCSNIVPIGDFKLK